MATEIIKIKIPNGSERVFNLYKQRFMNSAEVIRETMDTVFSCGEDGQHILKKYVKLKAKYTKTKMTDEEFFKYLFRHVLGKEYNRICNSHIQEKYTKTMLKEKKIESYRVKVKGKKKKRYRLIEKNDKKSSNKQLLMNHDHCVDLQKISFTMKFTIPIIADFATTKEKAVADEYFIDSFICIMEKYNRHNIILKLNKFISSRILATNYSDDVIWNYLSNVSVDISNMVYSMFNFVTTLILYKLNATKFPVTFIHGSVKNQLKYKFREKFPIQYNPKIGTDEDSDGITSANKMEITLVRKDEGSFVLNNVNRDLEFNRFLKNNNITVTEEELKHAIKTLKLNKFQNQILFLFYSKIMDNFDLYKVNKKFYCALLLALKKWLEQKEAYQILPKILTGVIEDKIKSKLMNKKNFINKLMDSKIFIEIQDKYSFIGSRLEKRNPILQLISWLYFNTFIDENSEELNYRIEDATYELLLLLRDINL